MPSATVSVKSASLRSRILAAGVLLAICGAAAPALAQDSVSTTNGLPGDALTPYSTGAAGNQRKDYIVDMTGKATSWGSTFYYGPVAKASLSTPNPNPTFFNHLVATAGLSNLMTGVSPLPRAAYQAWAVAGQGVNSSRNALPTDDGTQRYGIVSSGTLEGQSIGFGMLEFAGGFNGVFGDSDDENNIISGQISFLPRLNSRVYVSRVVAATNRPSAASTLTSNSSLGLGGVDEAGRVHLYGDNFNVSAGDDPLTNRRLYRVDTVSRSISLVNQIKGSGPGDATATRTLLSTATNLTTPSLIPASVAGRSVLVGADMANNLLAEQTANTVTTATTHLAAGVSARGPVSFMAVPFDLVSNGTADAGVCAVLARAPSATKTRSISIWGANTNGSADLQMRFELPTDPAQLFDRADSFSPAAAHGSLGNQELTNYQSQVCFRGGNGPVAMTVLPGTGDLLLAAGVAATGGGATTPQSMDNYIAVCRVDRVSGAATWTIAAHTGGPNGAAGNSKAILGRDPGTGALTTIGEIAKYNEVNPGATAGPSLSAPAMDKFGNVYFMATIQLNTLPQPTRTTGLLRANFDQGTNSYQLELMAQVGDVLAGRNSAKNYQIQFLSPADADSVDSGGLWHSSITQQLSQPAQLAADAGAITYGSPFTLGAMVFRTKIVYDMNGDNIFADPTAAGGVGSPDQAYNIAMLVLPPYNGVDIADGGGSPLPDGTIDGGDFIAFINAFASGEPLADIAAAGGFFPDGTVDGDDFIAFINGFAAGGN